MQPTLDSELVCALYSFPSPSDIARQLVWNSLDSKATKVMIDFSTPFTVSVEDDGVGFPAVFKLGDLGPDYEKPHSLRGQSLKLISIIGELSIYSRKKRLLGSPPIAAQGTRVSVSRLYAKVCPRLR